MTHDQHDDEHARQCVSCLVLRLKDHERHAVHDYDDDCEAAAAMIERLSAAAGVTGQ